MPTIHNGDCIETMSAMPPESVDAIVTDPPYGLGFMGKKWDGLPPSLEWAEACYRVLKPGGHIAAFGGTRTWHRLAAAIEDAGFEMRDSLAWLYGSGFPKSHDVGKAIDKRPGVMHHAEFARHLKERRESAGLSRSDVSERVVGTRTGACWNWEHHQFPEARWWPALRDLLDMDEARWGPVIAEAEREVIQERTMTQGGGTSLQIRMGEVREVQANITAPATPEAERWQGWGTALKPAFEPIVLARKPLAEKTVARNVLAHGTGAINVDACRIGTTERPLVVPDRRGGNEVYGDGLQGSKSAGTTTTGRWPANVLLDQHAAAWVDEQSGVQKDGVAVNRNKNPDIEKPHTVYGGGWMNGDLPDITYGGGGGASRFFYTAKAPKRERPNVDGVQHPTVKPLAIMRWLIRLVTPPGGVVLDPFAGSGATIEAALIEGFDPVGIEMEADYLPLIQHRIDRQAGTLTA